ncbi:MAG: alpha/beta hydrolase, partial [Actinomycetes bacterium]
MIANRAFGLTAVALAVATALLGCGSASTGADHSAAPNSSIIGQVAPESIGEPPTELLQAAGISPAAARAAVSEARTFTWNLVRVGDVTMAAACAGSGSPTIVYSNGLIIQAAWTWPVIATRQAKTNRVCMFDRPGTGLSPTRPDSAAPNGPVANAHELLALMQALNETGPFVIVGWSYGGLVARTAAAVSPDSVAGLDLVDAVTPAQYRTFDTSGWTEANQDLDMAAAERATGVGGPNLGSKPVVVLQAGLDSELG